MTTTPTTNKVGFTRKDYIGGKSTLCTGCGHDSITNHIISAYYQSSVSPYEVAKLSGIGCSSKTPTYFMGLSHGFNSLHGRMAPMSIGARLAHRKLNLIGVSGDGDTASIGLGGFIHLIRRNPPVVYIVENNGVYGLTKGQFSATADHGSVAKSGEKNPFSNIDLCSLAMEMGCGFVARSFSGDARQMVPLLDAAIRYPGTAFIDVISPCVTFANNEGSTKSYAYVKEHKVDLQELGFIQPQQEISVDYAEGEVIKVKMHDDSILTLRKIDAHFDHTNANTGLATLRAAREKGEILTGLLHLNESKENLVDSLNITNVPLRDLKESDLRPTENELKKMMQEFV